MTTSRLKLYTYWRSQAAFRVRIALGLKRLEAELIPIDILKGEQFAPDYRKLNAESVVPTLIDGDAPPLTQSLAILEYLDEQYPQPPLLPATASARAYVRALAQMLAMDAHPFAVPRVRNYLERELKVDEPARIKWIRYWLDLGLAAFETRLATDSRTGKFCYGDTPTIADLCLAAHVVSAMSLPGFDFASYPVTKRIFESCMQLDAFAQAHPQRQPDAPKAAR